VFCLLAATFSDFKSSIYAQTIEKTTLLKIPVRFISQWSAQYSLGINSLRLLLLQAIKNS
jgi:hypothetical protein